MHRFRASSRSSHPAIGLGEGTSHPVWCPVCVQRGCVCWAVLGRGGRGSALPENLLSWHLLLPGYQGDVLNAALKIQNTDSSPSWPGLLPSLPSSSGA